MALDKMAAVIHMQPDIEIACHSLLQKTCRQSECETSPGMVGADKLKGE